MVKRTKVALAAVLQLAGCAEGPGMQVTDEAETGSGTTTLGTSSSVSGETASSDATTGAMRSCNGQAALCDRPYDQVVFAATHNAHAALDDGFSPLNANQVHTLAKQLDDGVRCLLIDVTYGADGSTATCHGPCGLGSRPHLEVLQDIAGFMADHPDEVLTIIYEDDADQGDIEADLVESGLVDWAYVHEGGAWPTLGEMIDADARLVVTAQYGGPPPGWYHNVWNVAFDTPYEYSDPSEMDCSLNRGDASNDLFLLNHWVGTDAGLPSSSQAEVVNAHDFLLERAERCAAEHGRRVNFVAVDFYEKGDLFLVVDELNGFE